MPIFARLCRRVGWRAGCPMTLPPPKICERIRALHALLGSPVANEAETALRMLTKLLTDHGLSWNDLPPILAADATVAEAQAAAAAPAATNRPPVNVLDLVLTLVEEHVALTAEETMAVALWILHSWVFDRFAITPRLAALSPVRGCGKTTLLILIELLTSEAHRSDNVSAAALYYQLDRRPRATLLVDEGDNLDILRNGTLRAVFNSGHRRGGNVARYVAGKTKKFGTFAPLAIAAIGILPLPMLHRAVMINMQRPTGDRPIRRLDEDDPAFPATRSEIRRWADTSVLNRDPDMPHAVRGRAADNWRVLLAIADDLGHGDAARHAALKLSADRPDEDPGVMLLTDIKTIFDARGVDRIASAALVAALLALEDGGWNEWRGSSDDGQPRKLTQGELARLLRPFHIRSKTIWRRQRQPGDQSKRGYLRSQFEETWRRYCPSSDTPTQAGNIKHLPR